MSERIEAYGLIGDLHTAALVSRNGSLAWLCWPDFDSEACFAGLLGDDTNGVWTLAPASFRSQTRRYLPGTLVLESRYRRLGGEVSVTDFMPIRDGHSAVIRIVRGLRGRVAMQTCFAPRFDYGHAEPVIQQLDARSWCIITGPHRLTLRADVALTCKGGDLAAAWTIKAGETHAFVLQRSNAYNDDEPGTVDAADLQNRAAAYWTSWLSQNTYQGPYREAVERSLITLKALTYAPSGGFVAAPTTSLPEKVGGIRNWDYRFCWLRDTTFSLKGLLDCGFKEDARKWVQWLSRSVQGNPAGLRIMYGITGKREHSEWTAKWLGGYMGSQPVHIGNKASDQLQLDTWGEVLDALCHARQNNIYPHADKTGAALEAPLLAHLEQVWQEPDQGLWEFRSNAQHFTESKVMAWVAFDRGIQMAEKYQLVGPVDHWRKIRAQIHADVCKKGFHRGMNTFTQAYGNRHLDASLLLLPLVGFLPIDDPRVTGTVRAVERHLLRDGLLQRYDTAKVRDGLPPGEGAFLACNFWLVDVYAKQGRHAEAKALFERLLSLANDLGLLSEEYDPKHGLIGNFPQAFSHIGLIHAALALAKCDGGQGASA